jgi:AraC-like DNA-binding protein
MPAPDIYEDQKYVEHVNLPIPENVGSGCAQAWTLATGMVIIKVSLYFKEEIRGEMISNSEIQMKFNEPTFQVHSIIQGQISHKDLNSGKSFIFNRESNLFTLTDNLHFQPSYDSSEDIEIITLLIGQSLLVDLLGKDATKHLLENLGLSTSSQTRIYRIPLHINAPLHQAINDNFSPAIKCCFAQAKALEYLTNLSELKQTKVAKVKRRVGKKEIAQLHQYLTESSDKFPTLLDLSEKFGRSAQSLNEDFIAEYGVSIYSFIQEHRMKHAYDAILNTEAAIKQLSIRLGYSHVNNFSAAFKRKYGVAPGSLRKATE